MDGRHDHAEHYKYRARNLPNKPILSSPPRMEGVILSVGVSKCLKHCRTQIFGQGKGGVGSVYQHHVYKLQAWPPTGVRRRHYVCKGDYCPVIAVKKGSQSYLMRIIMRFAS